MHGGGGVQGLRGRARRPPEGKPRPRGLEESGPGRVGSQTAGDLVYINVQEVCGPQPAARVDRRPAGESQKSLSLGKPLCFLLGRAFS